MIDYAGGEEFVTLAEVARDLKKCQSTIHRWATLGLKGITLETITVGASLQTTREAVQRFFVALAARKSGRTVVPATRMSAARKRAIDKASKELDEAGF